MKDITLSKILYHLTLNSRTTTKSLGKRLHRSQQVASYLINQLKKKETISYKTVIDPSRLGLINVYGFYNYKIIDNDQIYRLLSDANQHPDIITVDNVSQGADLILEFCIPNLSYFNKQHRKILHKYKEILQVASVYVVIVKHIYERKYLVDNPSYDEVILCGDRDVFPLKDRQRLVLEALNSDAKEKLVKIADRIGIDPKTVVLLKKHLEFRKIITKYTISLNYQNAGIRRRYILLQPQFDDIKDMKRLLNFAKQHPNIVEVIKIIGDHELMLVIEHIYSVNVIADIRKHFRILSYRIIESEHLQKQFYTPLGF